MGANSIEAVESSVTPRAAGPRERRVGARKALDLPVDLLVDGHPFRGRVLEASFTGMLVELPHALADREPALLSSYVVYVAGREPLHLMARTVWRRADTQAARFVAVGDQERDAIVKIVGTTRDNAISAVARLEIAEAQDRLARARRSKGKKGGRAPERARRPSLAR